MWLLLTKLLPFFYIFSTILCKIDEDFLNQHAITTKTFAIWENATVPFYVNSDHFDHEQTTQILTALSMFAFRTCIKFMPVMAPPTKEDVLVFQNPQGGRRCNIHTYGHSVYRPHVLELGYDCLKSPQIDMMIMKALGFTFEHNRITRDNYIEVLPENIEQGAVDLFTKEDNLPMELRFLPYDINSVMHFDVREYSKNGHRTIIIKDFNLKQNRVGLTPTDLKKIEIVYGPQCRSRDRQEKIELCQSYPGVARKKRDVEDKPHRVYRIKRSIEEDLANKSLRVNPDITPPPDDPKEDITVMDSFKDLGIDDEVQQIVENAYKVSALALKNAREKYCNNNNNSTKPEIKKTEYRVTNRSSSDILGIIEVVADYAKDMVDNAMKNLTKFCDESGNIEIYQRARCDWNSGDSRCRGHYKSTKSGNVRYSTQHVPIYYMSTKNHGNPYKSRQYGRSGNDTIDLVVSSTSRIKRGVEESTEPVLSELTAVTEKAVKSTDLKDQTKSATVETLTKGDEKEEVVQEKKGEEETIAKDNLRMGTGPPSLKHHLYDRRSFKGIKRASYDSSKSEEKKPTKKKHTREEIKRPKKAKELEYSSENLDDIKKPREERKRPKKDREGNQYPRKDKERKRPKEPEESKRPREPKEIKRPRDREERQRPKEGREERKRPREDKRERKRPKEKRPKRPKESYREESNTNLLDKKENKGSDEEYKVRPKKVKLVYAERESDGALPRTVPLSKANLEFYNERMWPGGVVWFMIQEDTTYDTDDMRRRIEDVNQILKRKTCVKLEEISSGQVNKYEDYLIIDNSPDYVTGKVGGKQLFGSIEMFRGDQHRQHTAMMVMAMLGFYFEVARHDRDKHVRVHMRHVRPDKLHHFEKIRSDATLPLPYDYESATHPAWQFWRQLGRTGISTVATFKEHDPDGTIMKSLGQNKKLLSDTDIVKINSVYGVKCFQNPRTVLEEPTKTNGSIPLVVE